MGSSVSIPQVSAKTMVGVTGCSAPMLQPRNVGPGDSPGSRCEVAMWSLPPSDTVLHLLSYVALTAQAMTAALAAGRRSTDWGGGGMLGGFTRLRGGAPPASPLPSRPPRPHHPRPVARALSAGLGAEPVLSRADGGGRLRHHF